MRRFPILYALFTILAAEYLLVKDILLLIVIVLFLGWVDSFWEIFVDFLSRLKIVQPSHAIYHDSVVKKADGVDGFFYFTEVDCVYCVKFKKHNKANTYMDIEISQNFGGASWIVVQRKKTAVFFFDRKSAEDVLKQHLLS